MQPAGAPAGGLPLLPKTSRLRLFEERLGIIAGALFTLVKHLYLHFDNCTF
jgi:hypothetical protein